MERSQRSSADRDGLAVADLTNRMTETNHNGRKLEEIIAEFRSKFLRLLDRLEELRRDFFN